jgi:hypothetical protein
VTVALNPSSGVSPGVPRDNSIQISVRGDRCPDLEACAFQTHVICQASARVVEVRPTWTVGSMSLVVAIGKEFNRARSILSVTTTTMPAR